VNLAGFSGSAARSSRERAWPGRDLRVALAAGAFLADLREPGRAGPRIGSVEATTPAERRSWFGRTCMVDADEVLGRVGLDRLAHDQRSPDGVRPDRVLVPGRALDEAEPVGPAAHRGAAVAPQHPAASTTTMMWALVATVTSPSRSTGSTSASPDSRRRCSRCSVKTGRASVPRSGSTPCRRTLAHEALIRALGAP
jgi:hypothetical protein